MEVRRAESRQRAPRCAGSSRTTAPYAGLLRGCSTKGVLMRDSRHITGIAVGGPPTFHEKSRIHTPPCPHNMGRVHRVGCRSTGPSPPPFPELSPLADWSNYSSETVIDTTTNRRWGCSPSKPVRRARETHEIWGVPPSYFVSLCEKVTSTTGEDCCRSVEHPIWRIQRICESAPSR